MKTPAPPFRSKLGFMSRRSFLSLGVLVIGLLAISWVWLAFRRNQASDLVVAILRRRVGYLKTPPGCFQEFAESYLVDKAKYRELLDQLAVLAFPLTYVTIYPFLSMNHGLRRLENTVVSQFLLSTDFFQNGADESRELKYIAYYDPYVAACRHPFRVAAAPLDAASGRPE